MCIRDRLRRLGHQLGQRGTAPLATRSGGDRGFGIELQPLGGHGHAVILALGQARGGIVAQRGKTLQIGVLLHIANADPRRHDADAVIGL